MLCLSGFELYSRWVPLMFAAGDVFKMLVFYSILARQYAQYGNVLCMWIFFRSQYVSTLSTAMFMYVVVLFSLSTLVRLVLPSVFHACLYFIRSLYVSTLSTAMFYDVCWYCFRSQYVSTLSTTVFYVGISFGLRTLVRLVRPCSIDVGILFGLSTLSTAMFSACWYFIRSFWYFIRSQYAKYGQLFHFYRHACMAFFSFTTEHSM